MLHGKPSSSTPNKYLAKILLRRNGNNQPPRCASYLINGGQPKKLGLGYPVLPRMLSGGAFVLHAILSRKIAEHSFLSYTRAMPKRRRSKKNLCRVPNPYKIRPSGVRPHSNTET